MSGPNSGLSQILEFGSENDSRFEAVEMSADAPSIHGETYDNNRSPRAFFSLLESVALGLGGGSFSYWLLQTPKNQEKGTL